jgi:Family of unknown function (DUF6527)
VNWLDSLWRSGRNVVSLPSRWWSKKQRNKPKRYRNVHVDEFPDSFEPSKLYLAGENGYLWAAALLCPCGCGDLIELNLLKKARPCWSVQEHPDGFPTLMPSVWRREGCRSHFYLRRGHIVWCREYSTSA